MPQSTKEAESQSYFSKISDGLKLITVLPCECLLPQSLLSEEKVLTRLLLLFARDRSQLANWQVCQHR